MESIFENAKLVLFEALQKALLSFLDAVVESMDNVNFGVFNEAIKSLVKFVVVALKKYIMSLQSVVNQSIDQPILRF